jgi:hypothetical protein
MTAPRQEAFGAFAPAYVPTVTGVVTGTLVTSVTIAATVASGTGTLPNIPSVGYSDQTQIQVANTSSSWAYVNFGLTAATVPAATVAASYPVGPGAVIVLSVNSEVTGVAVILSSGTGNVIFSRGAGI